MHPFNVRAGLDLARSATVANSSKECVMYFLANDGHGLPANSTRQLESDRSPPPNTIAAPLHSYR
jgi:hypothetical protein